MAYTSGTAANYKDLLAILATFAAANGWVILEQSETKLYLKGTGLAGLDEIYCGVETYEDAPNNRYNWQMVGSWGYRAGRALSKHPRSSNFLGTDFVVAHLWNAAIPYWMVCTPRRIIVVAKVGATYQHIHLGLLTVPATDAQYPYPLLIGGGSNSFVVNYSAALNAYWSTTARATASFCCQLAGGAWGVASSSPATDIRPSLNATHFHEASRLITLTGLDGAYLLEPVCIATYSSRLIIGFVEGLFRVTGYNNTAENIITVDGVNYMVFPDGSKSGYGDYCAMRLN